MHEKSVKYREWTRSIRLNEGCRAQRERRRYRIAIYPGCTIVTLNGYTGARYSRRSWYVIPIHARCTVVTLNGYTGARYSRRSWYVIPIHARCTVVARHRYACRTGGAGGAWHRGSCAGRPWHRIAVITIPAVFTGDRCAGRTRRAGHRRGDACG